jgi:hypothetical protein
MSTTPRWPASRVTLVTLLLGLVIGGAAAGMLLRKSVESPRSNPAVQRVLRVYGELTDTYLAAKPGTSLSQYARALGQVCEALESQDMSGCPRDFQVACTQNIRAIRDAQALLHRCPDSFLQGMAMGATNYLLRGEADGGLARLEHEVAQALKRIRLTSDEVERIAAKYTD